MPPNDGEKVTGPSPSVALHESESGGDGATSPRPSPPQAAEREKQSRTWGFRFSVVDGVVIAVGGAALIWLRQDDSPLWWIVAMVVVHFFLFCNVFRVRRKYELWWAVLFIFNAGLWLWYRDYSVGKVVACQSIIKVKVILAEIWRPRYHGIFAPKINRRLHEYLEGKIP